MAEICQLNLFPGVRECPDDKPEVVISDGPKVWNKYKHCVPEGAVFIGRPSKWGNPYMMGLDGSREEVIEKFRIHLAESPKLIQAAKNELAGKHLLCFCKPAPCHGDILLSVANSKI